LSHTKGERDEIVRREREWQNRVGGRLQEGLRARAGTRLLMAKQFGCMAEALNPDIGSSIVDVGCGTGMLSKWLEDNRRVNVIGVDLALNNLLLGKKEGVRKMLCGNAELLPIKDSCFRYLICKGSVHHFPDPEQAFKEIYRVLIPGGKMVFYEPMGSVLTNLMRKIFPGGSRYESPVDLLHKEEFTPSKIQLFLQQTGFDEIKISFYDVLAFPLTGAYAGGLFSGSVTIMKALLQCEKRLEQVSFLTGLRRFFSWRMLVKASKPSLS
jgi:ubiquinone/menaquinone biosynthesis C-methylase UbiE